MVLMHPEATFALARDEAVPDDVNIVMVPDYPPKLAESRDEIVPSSLQLHGPQTIHQPDLLFMNTTPSMTAAHTANLSPSSSISNQLYPSHQQAFPRSTFSPPPISTSPKLYPHHVYHHWSMPSSIPPPPLPPKPTVYPTINPDASREEYQVNPSPPPLPPPPIKDEVIVTSLTEDTDELAMVLALSQSESVRKKLLEELLIIQEEDDLAKALSASMLPTESNFPSPGNPTNGLPESMNALDIHSSLSHTPLASPPNGLPSVMPGGPSEAPSGSFIPHDTYAEFGRYDKWRIPNHPGKQHEEAQIETQLIVIRGETPCVSSVSLLPYDAPPPPELATKRSTISSVSSQLYSMPERRSSQLPEYSHIDGDKSLSQETSFSGHFTVRGADLSSDLVSPGTVLEFDDAAYARQLAAEEKLLKQPSQSEEGQQDSFVDQAKPSSTSYGKQNAEWHRPQSGRTMSHEGLYGRQYPQDVRASIATASISVPTFSSMVQSTHSPPAPNYSFPTIGRATSYQPDIQSKIPENRNLPIRTIPVVYPSLGSRRGSASDTQSETSQNSSPLLPHTDRPQIHLDTPQRLALPHARRLSQALPPQTIATTSATPLNQNALSPAGALNVNHFVDLDLLRGVSIGFKGPTMSTRLLQMQDPIPNIISLPYTRCPPLHLQAPDWRHLLRLMARLSGTRMEPTVEALAVSKAELKLRTVIQFVKPHPGFNDWRSVLWFTIDQPVPSSIPGALRYTSGNPNLLPWSYTLSPIPALLRDASDTNMSKAYTIPATDTIPLPTLPITFPNLALYLQAALDTSRQHLSNNPNGLGKLAKMVQMCYPSVDKGHSEYDIPERTGVGHLFKRVIGRGNKDKKKAKETNNEDTYQLVTPFVPDEWG